MLRPPVAHAVVLALVILAGNGCCYINPYRYDGDCGGRWSGRLTGTADCGQCGSCETCPGGEYTFTGRVKSALTCGGGCGDMYWGEWSYDPPQDCDPCDNFGNYVGPTCCPPRPLKTLFYGLFGARYCDFCAGPCQSDHGEFVELQPVEIWESENDQPIPATQPPAQAAPGNPAARPKNSVIRRR